MLTVYLHDDRDTLRFKLIGEMDGEGAGEFEQSWRTASSTLRGRGLVIDLSEVTGIGREGRLALERVAPHRARFITASAQADDLVRQISGRKPDILPAPAFRGLRALWCLAARFMHVTEPAARKCWGCCRPVRRLW